MISWHHLTAIMDIKNTIQKDDQSSLEFLDVGVLNKDARSEDNPEVDNIRR